MIDQKMGMIAQQIRIAKHYLMINNLLHSYQRKEIDVVGDKANLPSEDENEDEEVSADVSRLSSSVTLFLLLFFDCESTSRSMYNDHIIEVGVKVVAVLSSDSISQH